MDFIISTIFIIVIIIGVFICAKLLGKAFAKGFLQELNTFMDFHFHKIIQQKGVPNGKKEKKTEYGKSEFKKQTKQKIR